MRMELTFELEKLELPIDYRSIWISFLKNCLSHCKAGIYYERYFGHTHQKDYSFTIRFAEPQFQKEIILLGRKEIKMTLSCDDRQKTGLIFGNALIGAKQKRFPLPNGNAMILKRVDYVREQLITSSSVMFKTGIGSGIVVREHDPNNNKDRFYTYQDAEFAVQLKRVLSLQAEAAGFGFEVGANVLFKPIQCKKVVVKHYQIFMDMTVGIFQLEGDPDFLQYLYQAGMGSKHSSGFGLIDIVAQKITE